MAAQTAFITGADRGLGLALCAGLLERGWQVFAGQYLPEWPELASMRGTAGALSIPGMLHIVSLDVGREESAKEAARLVGEQTDHIDLLINNAGVTSLANQRSIREAQDYAEMQRLYNVNALGPLRVVEAFLPLTDRGGLKRLCFVSSEAGSIGKSYRTAWFGYCMSKAALNMAVKNLYNHLAPEGYSFRLYHPGWMRTYMGGTKNDKADMEPEEAAGYALDYFLGERAGDLALVDYAGNEYPW